MKRVVSVFAAALFLAATASYAATSSTGWISNTMCGAHMADGTAAHVACIKSCIAHGNKPVFVDAKKNVWKIDNPSAINSKFYGARVRVKATEDASNKTMHIDSIMAAK